MAHSNGQAATIRQQITLRTASRLLKLEGSFIVEEFRQRGWDVLRYGRGRRKRVRLIADQVLQYQQETAAADTRQDKARADLIAEMVREGIRG